MNLSDFVKKIDTTQQEFKPGQVEYENETVNFQFKKQMSTADYEYIFLRDVDSDDHSVLVRRIVRLVRDENGEKFDHDHVSQWPPLLVILISTYTVENAEDKKKTDKQD